MVTAKKSEQQKGDDEAGRILDIQGALGIAAEGNIDFAGISIWNLAVFPRIPSETRVSFVPILIEWMKRGGKIGRSAPFSAFSPLRPRTAATGLC